MNSLTSSPTTTPLLPNQKINLNLDHEEESQGYHNEENAPNPSLRWTWVDGIGPYLITGELRTQTELSSDTESDFEIVRLFNLDKLNEGRSEWLCWNAWDVGQVPEAIDSFVQPLVNKVDSDSMWFEIGNSSFGPSIRRTTDVGQHLYTAHHVSNSLIGASPT